MCRSRTEPSFHQIWRSRVQPGKHNRRHPEIKHGEPTHLISYKHLLRPLSPSHRPSLRAPLLFLRSPLNPLKTLICIRRRGTRPVSLSFDAVRAMDVGGARIHSSHSQGGFPRLQRQKSRLEHGADNWSIFPLSLFYSI